MYFYPSKIVFFSLICIFPWFMFRHPAWYVFILYSDFSFVLFLRSWWRHRMYVYDPVSRQIQSGSSSQSLCYYPSLLTWDHRLPEVQQQRKVKSWVPGIYVFTRSWTWFIYINENMSFQWCLSYIPLVLLLFILFTVSSGFGCALFQLSVLLLAVRLCHFFNFCVAMVY